MIMFLKEENGSQKFITLACQIGFLSNRKIFAINFDIVFTTGLWFVFITIIFCLWISAEKGLIPHLKILKCFLLLFIGL